MAFKPGDMVICNDPDLYSRASWVTGQSDEYLKAILSPGKVISCNGTVTMVEHICGNKQVHSTRNLKLYVVSEKPQQAIKPSVSPYMNGSIYSCGPDGETLGPSGNKWL